MLLDPAPKSDCDSIKVELCAVLQERFPQRGKWPSASSGFSPYPSVPGLAADGRLEPGVVDAMLGWDVVVRG